MTTQIIEEIQKELHKAKLKFPTWPSDPLHAASVIGEEYGELIRALLHVTYEPGKSTVEDVRTEAIQTAAMLIRFLESMDRYEFLKSTQHTQVYS